MGKKIAFLHVGPPVPDLAETHELLVAEAGGLAEAGLAVPPVSGARMFHAGLEILRRHKDEGLRRREVEGAWASVCRKAEKCRGDVLISQDLLADATAGQIALLLDGLAAFKVHVIATPHGTSGDEGSLEDVLAPWARHVKPQRLHVLRLTDEDPAGFVAALTRTALEIKEAELEKRIAKLDKKRRRVRRKLAEAS
jgi:hypothetical protein